MLLNLNVKFLHPPTPLRKHRKRDQDVSECSRSDNMLHIDTIILIKLQKGSSHSATEALSYLIPSVQYPSLQLLILAVAM